jgi:hypothetical protein
MPKKSGGPNTSVGKARSAQNALKHGMTSTKPTSAHESQLVELYIQELSNYYQPQSPLEKLQIERIALCRAKLAHLYEVEQVRLQLVMEEIDQSPEKVLEQFGYLPDIAKGMVLEQIRFGQLRLPASLGVTQLQSIVREIHAFDGTISCIEDVQQYFPALCRYLNRHPDVVIQNMAGLEGKLRLVNEELTRCISRGKHYMEYAWVLLRPAVEQERKKEALEKEKMTPEEEELEKYVRETQEQFAAERAVRSHKVDLSGPRFPTHATWIGELGNFVTIFSHQERAQAVFERYEHTKALLKRSAQLPASESDLLMRYQTTLERRLSSAIGELLELQRRKSSS